MLASPPSTRNGVNAIRTARFAERSSRRLSPSQHMSGLLLDSQTIEKHQMANGFGSGSGLVPPNGLSSRESSPPGPSHQQSQVSIPPLWLVNERRLTSSLKEFYFADGNVVFLVRLFICFLLVRLIDTVLF